MLWRDFGFSTIDQELRRMQHEVDRVFNRYGTQSERTLPAVNAYAYSDEVLVTSELPGVTPDDIDIAIEGNTLGLTVTRKPDEAKDRHQFHRRERWYGKFNRTLTIPFQIDSEKVNARFSKGILYLTLPKAESEKPRKIQIEVA